ncbi:hypothetical protein WR25_14940 [Diploscapter pachys]|uniref:UDP-glucose:glycoprotein glucosyltransferase thioredoxin-like domain-containing protein n=1 Tax=Diploscapter pachys TaxID=2018661 RepID=A0A2A2LRX4_9BILA|nr:hypothetical protein WR25_14940 [Diploscapter pachys]
MRLDSAVFLFLPVFSIFLLVGHAESLNDKNVIVSLNAKWPSTSLIAEASEFLGKENNETFWKYVSKVADKFSGLKKEWKELRNEKKYELALEQAAGLVDLGLLDLLKFSLSLRAFSPAVQLFQQIGSEYSSINCDAFFDVNGKIGCTSQELEDVLKNPPKETDSSLLSVDHVHPASKKSATTVLVYGEMGSPEWIELHKTAESLCKQGKIQYVFRHFTRSPIEERVYLSGYGVELAIKNTEYKAEDDSKKKAEEVVEDEEDLHGFNFKLLKELHSDSKDSLDAFRMHLKEIEELAPLKQWQVQDLAFQAAQRIVNEEPHNAIAMLKELSQNFPLHAQSLSRESVTRQMRDEIEINQRDALSEKGTIMGFSVLIYLCLSGLDAGDSALFINGINLDMDSLDMFQLLDLLKQEQRLSTGFHNIGIGREYFSLLSHVDTSDDKVNYAVDYREAYPFFINNLDTDSQYKQWGNSIKLMLQPYYPGMIRPIARNLFTLIFIVNPAYRESRNLLRIAQTFFQHEIPIRIGFVFMVNPDKEVSGKTDPGVALLNLYNFMSVDSSNSEALIKLNKFFDLHKTSDEISVEDIKVWFEKTFHDVEYDDVFGPDSDYDKGRQAK